jgi:Flp pilus assembly protein TadD
MEQPITPMGAYDRFRWAEELFADRQYRTAAQVLEHVLHPDNVDELGGVGTTDARLLLARAYFFSAQLGRAEREARTVLEDQPTEAYAALLLGRTLQRGQRHDEARTYLAMAEAMGLSADR